MTTWLLQILFVDIGTSGTKSFALCVWVRGSFFFWGVGGKGVVKGVLTIFVIKVGN